MKHHSSTFPIMALGLLGLLSLRAAEPPRPAEPLRQPVAFSHRQHSLLGLQCVSCHPGSKEKETAGIPDAEFCLRCHASVSQDSPDIQKLAAYEKERQTVPWVRVYQLPGFVFFSHKFHADAGVECDQCHGPVEKREVLFQEKAVTMKSCVDCHKEAAASVDCHLCHELNF